MVGAVAGELVHIAHPFIRVAERSGGGQCDVVEHTVGDSGPFAGRQPVFVALPRRHEAHGLAAVFHQFLGQRMGLVVIVD